MVRIIEYWHPDTFGEYHATQELISKLRVALQGRLVSRYGTQYWKFSALGLPVMPSSSLDKHTFCAKFHVLLDHE